MNGRRNRSIDDFAKKTNARLWQTFCTKPDIAPALGVPLSSPRVQVRHILSHVMDTYQCDTMLRILCFCVKDYQLANGRGLQMLRDFQRMEQVQLELDVQDLLQLAGSQLHKHALSCEEFYTMHKPEDLTMALGTRLKCTWCDVDGGDPSWLDVEYDTKLHKFNRNGTISVTWMTGIQHTIAHRRQFMADLAPGTSPRSCKLRNLHNIKTPIAALHSGDQDSYLDAGHTRTTIEKERRALKRIVDATKGAEQTLKRQQAECTLLEAEMCIARGDVRACESLLRQNRLQLQGISSVQRESTRFGMQHSSVMQKLSASNTSLQGLREKVKFKLLDLLAQDLECVQDEIQLQRILTVLQINDYECERHADIEDMDMTVFWDKFSLTAKTAEKDCATQQKNSGPQRRTRYKKKGRDENIFIARKCHKQIEKRDKLYSEFLTSLT